MMSIGIRRTMLGGLLLMSLASSTSLWMTAPWQYLLTWGEFSGLGTGAVASVLGAAVVNRWYAARQGLVMELLSASTATGALVFMPLLAWLSRNGAWRPVAATVSIACLLPVPVVALLVPERPEDIGARRFGEREDSPPPAPPKQARSAGLAIGVLLLSRRAQPAAVAAGTA